MAHDLVGVGLGLEDQGFEDNDAPNSAAVVLHPPHWHPAQAALAEQWEQVAHRSRFFNHYSLVQGDGYMADGNILQVEDTIDHGAFLGGKRLGRLLHDQSQFVSISEEVAGETP